MFTKIRSGGANSKTPVRVSLYSRGLTSTFRATRKTKLTMMSIFALSLIAVAIVVSNLLWDGKLAEKPIGPQEVERLRVVNKDLTDKYEKLRWELADLNSRYDDLVQREIAIRRIFDLPQISSEVRQQGVGGPSTSPTVDATGAELAAYNTENDVEKLNRQVRFQAEQFEEISNVLQLRKFRLDHTPSISPAIGQFSRGFGIQPNPFTGVRQPHRGIDIANNRGTPIVATADGKIAFAGRERGMGNMVTVNHGFGFATRYGHLDQILVATGDLVKRGDVIALMGNTGHSTGPHVHYEVLRNGRNLNPLDFVIEQNY